MGRQWSIVRRRYSGSHARRSGPLMDGAIWGFVGVVIGGIITGLVTLGAEKLRADKAAALDSSKRQDDRRVAHDNFQRETLLALQDAVQDLARATIQIHHHDVMTARSEKPWGSTLVGVEISAAHLQAHRRLTTLRSRVADSQIRERTTSLLDRSIFTIGAKDQETAEQASFELGVYADRVLERSGELIRATYRAE